MLTARSRRSERYCYWRIEYMIVLQAYLLDKLDEVTVVSRLTNKFRELAEIDGRGGLLVVEVDGESEDLSAQVFEVKKVVGKAPEVIAHYE
ncbi:hypothetical protein ACONUD_01140 [Microbulbifer harenosus]|uniref:DUF4911 domain-containing protein n=1 Tax=Microbulbifer harenosus TaxID=2576840 RepID=A0ABY2UN17_9GAMM|nr:hypothetical protein [Microbulbifer harenosus]TLM80007.1 hypothetical protein FDY93_01130 [Microbulbifer harenosus]